MANDLNTDEIVRVATAANVAEAYAWRQALEEEGISCRVVGEYLTSVGIPPNETSPEIWVHHKDVDRARSILKTWVERSA